VDTVIQDHSLVKFHALPLFDLLMHIRAYLNELIGICMCVINMSIVFAYIFNA